MIFIVRGHNLQANHGRIEDADFASVTAYLAKSQIFQKVSAGTGQRLKEKRAEPATGSFDPTTLSSSKIYIGLASSTGYDFKLLNAKLQT